MAYKVVAKVAALALASITSNPELTAAEALMLLLVALEKTVAVVVAAAAARQVTHGSPYRQTGRTQRYRGTVDCVRANVKCAERVICVET